MLPPSPQPYLLNIIISVMGTIVISLNSLCNSILLLRVDKSFFNSFNSFRVLSLSLYIHPFLCIVAKLHY